MRKRNRGSAAQVEKLALGFFGAVASVALTKMNFSLDPYNILAGFVFGTIGWGAFSYGRKLELWQPKAIGLALMVYPYFFTNHWLLWGIGVGLLVVLWFHHDQ